MLRTVKLAALGGIAGFVGMVGASMPAHAVLVLETVDNLEANGIYGLAEDLVNVPNPPGPVAPHDIAEAANELLTLGEVGPLLFPDGVDYVGKVDLGSPDEPETLFFSDLRSGFSFDITCSASVSECQVLDWELVLAPEVVAEWSIVKIAIKAGTDDAYFLVDPLNATPGATSGTIDMSFVSPTSDSLFRVGPNGRNIADISHVEFFGSPNIDIPPPPDAPEPMTLGLVGLGLVGMGALRRRLRAA